MILLLEFCLFLDSPFSRGAVDIVLVVAGAKVLIEQGSIPKGGMVMVV